MLSANMAVPIIKIYLLRFPRLKSLLSELYRQSHLLKQQQTLLFLSYEKDREDQPNSGVILTLFLPGM